MGGVGDEEMSRNLNRLSAAANRMAARDDLRFVYYQLVQLGHTPPQVWHENSSARKIDRATREMKNWAKSNGIEIALPDGWKA